MGKLNLQRNVGANMAKILNSRQRSTLEAIYANPIRANINWTDIESLFVALGAIVAEGNGSRVCVALHGVKAVFHEPHPEKEAAKGTIRSVRDFLKKANVTPDSEL